MFAAEVAEAGGGIINRFFGLSISCAPADPRLVLAPRNSPNSISATLENEVLLLLLRGATQLLRHVLVEPDGARSPWNGSARTDKVS